MNQAMTAKQVVLAGGIVPTGSEADLDGVDGVTARSYQHPVLGERAVVRLVPEMLGSAEDLKLEYYGFGPAEQTELVGYQKRQSLGFPAWALVHDPARASFALEILKEWRKYARQGAARPGNAKAGFDEIGERLSRSVPHFLPSFWEECGRLFLEVSNLNYASVYFTKARTAEKAYALKVDEDDRREAFLEFALAGAVPVKALSEYSKDLQANYTPEVAYQQFRELCLRRTLGGMPPWSSMLKELSRMAVAAGLKAAAQEKAFFQEILSSPALARAPVEFWVSAKSSLTTLCKDEEVCRALLDLLPKFSGNRLKQGGIWLNLLRDWDVFRLLRAPGCFAGAADWLSKNIGHFLGYPDPNPNALFEIVRELAPQLVAAGQSVVLEPGWHFDLDLAELMASLGIPIEITDPGHYLMDASRWAQGKGPERPKDPIHLSRIPNIQAGLLATLESSIGTEPFESLTTTQTGWLEPRRSWLESCLNAMRDEALPSWFERVERLAQISNRALFAPYPDLYEELKNLSIVPAVMRSLRGGLLEEWSWPALEEAIALLGKVECWSGFFPYLVVANSHKAICVGPDSIVDQHDLLLPRGCQLKAAFWIEGQFCLTYWDNQSRRSYWSGQPNDIRETNYYGNPLQNHTVWGSGVSVGRQWISAGSFDLPERVGEIVSDGHYHWTREYVQDQYRLQEMDPRTGKLGRMSLPSFFEEGLTDGQKLLVEESCIYPIPSELGSTPLGGKDGLYACRVIAGESDSEPLSYQIGCGTAYRGVCSARSPAVDLDSLRPDWLDYSRTRIATPVGAEQFQPEVETAAGTYRTVSARNESRLVANPDRPVQKWIEAARRNRPSGLISLPDNSLRAVVHQQYWSLEAGYALNSSDYSDSYWLELPLHWWHMMRPRNLQISKFLRAIDEPQIEQWLSGSTPELDDPVLQQALVKLLNWTGEQQKTLADLLSRQEVSSGLKLISVQSIDAKICLESLGMSLPYQSVNLCEEISIAQAWIAEGEKASGTSQLALGLILPCSGQMGVLLWRSLMPGTDEVERNAIRQVLRQWSECAVCQQPEKFRLVSLIFRKPLSELTGQLQVGNSRFLVFALQHRNWGSYNNSYDLMDRAFVALEHSLDGQFRVPSEADLEWERPCQNWDSCQKLSDWLELATERGPMVWNREHAEALAAKAGLSYPEAALLWCGLPFVDSRENNFLPTTLREQLGLKASEARMARDTFSALTFEQRLQLYGSSLPAQPAEIWDHPMAAVERLATSWARISGVRIQVDPDCLAELNALDASLKPDVMLKVLADPSGPLGRDGKCKLTVSGELEQTPDTFESDHLHDWVLYVLHIHEYGSLSDPLRQPLVQAACLINERLKNPELLFLLGGTYMATPAEWENLKRSLGGLPVVGLDAVDNGALLAIKAPYVTNVYYRPSQPVHPLAQSLLMRMYSGPSLTPLSWLQNPDFQAILAELALPERQGYAANPQLSCPQLVDEVAQQQGLTQAAAILYLQSLALAAPTSKNILKWNGWSSKQYNGAAKELADRQLLIEAKRSRAGRNHFLPGPWLNLKSPHLPIERWKLPLYQLNEFGVAPLGRILAPKPLAKQFREAWDRLCAGDGPAFSEVE